MSKRILAVDIETNRKERPFCISFTDVGLHTNYYRWKDMLPKKVEDRLLDPNIIKIFHNAIFDVGCLLRTYGIKTAGIIHDTMIMAKLALPFKKRYGLKDLMLEDPFNEPCKEYEEVKKYVRKGYSYNEMPKDLMREYNKNDTRYTMKLFIYLKDIIKEPIYKLEQDLIWTVIDMERGGVRLNIPFTEFKLSFYELVLSRLRRYFEEFGLENPNNPKQVSTLLYDKLDLMPPVWKGKEHYSTDALALILLEDTHPLIKHLIDYRKISTVVNTFLRPFVEKSVNGFIHPKFNPMGQIDRRRIKTGRFSSSNPNFQNIPTGKEIRELVIPRKDHFFLNFDYSQIEMMLFAFMAKDKWMMKIYKEDGDVHTQHQEIFVDPFRKDKDGLNRHIAKQVGFEILYGIGAPGMTNYLHRQGIHLEIDMIKSMMMEWFKLHPSLVEYRRVLYRELRRNGFIKDCYGRRYYLSLGKSYMAVNYVMQGMSANVIKSVMPDVNAYTKALKGRLMLTVHDELVTELPNKHYDIRNEISKEIINIMTNPSIKIGVPLKVDYQVLEHNWGEKK